MFDFIRIKPLDILDVLLVAFLMFQLIRLIRKTNAINIFMGILMVYIVWIIVRILDMQLLSLILGQIIGVGVIALIIVFQPEIRKFLFLLGDRYSQRKNNFWSKFFLGHNYSSSIEWVDEIIAACESMAAKQTGALIVITGSKDTNDFIVQGVEIDAAVKTTLIESLFFRNSPLHDGAIIVVDGRIKWARCILPVSQNTSIAQHFGTRHRAALGATEFSKALVIVVSEERGVISFVSRGTIIENVSAKRLKDLVIEEW